MLVLSRRYGEEIHVGNEVVIKVLSTCGGRVRIGIEAPQSVAIRRGELPELDRRQHVRFEPANLADPSTNALLAGMAH
jgi:carbon storage regulator